MYGSRVDLIRIRRPRRRHHGGLLRAAVALLAGVLLAVPLGIKAYGTDHPAYRLVTVQAGDTVWTLAESHYSNGDVRGHVLEIEQVNRLTRPDLTPGQVLKLP